ncbi:MAG: tyrosine recombinase XerC [Clostridiales bacterium]|jgi:site-specific recombinase XerD|nr:tyrosine recombinase XerC [Clostridiales bacterium]
MNPLTLSDAPAVLKEFLGYMQTIKGKSEKTIQEYFFDLRTFFRYIKLSKGLVDSSTPFQEISIEDIDIKLLESVTLTDVFEFMNFVLSEKNNHAAARARKASSLRTFFHYLTNKTGQLSRNPVQELETPKLKKSLPKYLSLEQCIELLNSVEGEYKERDYCIIALFLNCGLRLSELVNLNINDIHLKEKLMKVTGKGNKERLVYLNEACIEAVEAYLRVRPVDGVIDKKALFISRLNKRIGTQAVQQMVKKYLAKIGLEGQGYSVHKLRHTAATLMYQHGHVDIRVLKDILGHENLGTTEIYTHLSDHQMADAANSNPLSKIKKRE